MLIKYLFTTLLFITIFNISCSITGDVESGNHVYSFYVSSDTTGSVVDTGSHQITETGEYELIADQPDIGYRFSYWKVVTGEENVTISDKDSVKAKVTNVKGNAAVRAVFMYSKLTLTFDGTAGGEATVSTAPVTGIQYGVATPFTATVNVNSAYAAQYEFLGQWVKVIGDITISGTTVTLKSDATIRPVLSTRKYSFTLTQPAQGGTISSSPAVGTVNYGTAIILTAAPATGWKFKNWTGGDANGKTTNPYTATLSGVTAYSAVFEKETYTLSVTVADPSTGTVTKAPDNASYPFETQVTLTATPNVGYKFAAWSGDVVSTTNPVIVSVSNNKSVTATFVPIPGVAGVVYVRKEAAGLNDGSNWVNAFTNLETAFANSGENKQIWIAGGTYKPTGAATAGFTPLNGSQIFGGFTGFESDTNRLWYNNFTTLTGNDYYHYVIDLYNKDNIKLNGFIIENAVRNCVYIQPKSSTNASNIIIANCIIRNNNSQKTYTSPQAIHCDGKEVVIKNCVFYNNLGGDNDGQALHISKPGTRVENCMFFNNDGPAISSSVTDLTNPATIISCTIYGNKSKTIYAGGIRALAGAIAVRGCILYANTNSTSTGGTQIDSAAEVIYCCIQDCSKNGV